MFRINLLSRILGAAAPPQAANDAGNLAPAHAVPPAPAVTAPAAPASPDPLAANLKTQGDAMVQYGARLLVIRELLGALAAGLPPAAQAGVERRFRVRVDQLLTLTDDRGLPAEFHDTLLAEINYYLGELKH
ncbi:hypothetical protein [Cupriavidus oxalaticus]|jgi:hypothetical protein|uniref:Uncharacterized protein n=1 Tax=Cupriavidus oxalaticus TaxID=96344 RepID=A0A375FMF1_9BURK|nr:hypothetical protein [Cupriavidus oxalaticus]QEZ44833.1 hypothetical protein D2917_11745 [Cupriavidus oxalaticus]QRQ83790.1 hypothetical protein JTE91_08175 [Cupriavidus oxalaticus]QRQ92121.1 hypothetical protein JTE92_04170 [Cupriavidus oxalaticus]WQD86720.1 hypothetical protein U0036_22275 [Cupriavidus oxalaticus]SPC05651.1 conserved exported hypothetical protein [Cupriavidus oxalaticus]